MDMDPKNEELLYLALGILTLNEIREVYGYGSERFSGESSTHN